MAYKKVSSYGRQLEEQKNPALGSGAPAGTGAAGAPGSATAAAPPSTFVNIKSYLDANPEGAQRTAGTILDPLRAQAEEGAKAATDYAQQRDAYDAWQMPEDPGQMPATPMRPGTLAGPKAWETWNAQRQAYAAWEAKKKAWDEAQAKGPPQAPSQPQSALNAWEAIQNAGTQAGRAESFSQKNPAPEYTPGAANLDSYLTGRVAGPELAGMQDRYRSILGELRGTGYTLHPTNGVEVGPDGTIRKRKG